MSMPPRLKIFNDNGVGTGFQVGKGALVGHRQRGVPGINNPPAIHVNSNAVVYGGKKAIIAAFNKIENAGPAHRKVVAGNTGSRQGCSVLTNRR